MGEMRLGWTAGKDRIPLHSDAVGMKEIKTDWMSVDGGRGAVSDATMTQEEKRERLEQMDAGL